MEVNALQNRGQEDMQRISELQHQLSYYKASSTGRTVCAYILLTHARTYSCIIHTHIHTHTHIYTHTHTHIHTPTHMHTYAHTYTYTQAHT